MSDNANFAKEITPVSLESRMKSDYLDYAMSVIVGRALPDARDGLKPVHRRTLFAMQEVGNDYNKPYKKSARIVGDVLGKYHPHGQDAVYDALVRMAQPFSMRDMLVDGQGNFGSIDGDNPAAMRYTEVRMSKIAHTLMADIDKETVDFVPNYDGAEHEPTVLPTRIPNLLINGSSGIAVGMATNIPPHNLGETIDAALLLLDNPDATVGDLQKIMPAPDFPTGALISGSSGIREAYTNGRGRVTMRAKTHFEDVDKSGNKQAIIIDELPYQVNKASLIMRIAELVRDKKLEGISDLRDESDRHGIRVVIELRRGENVEIVLNRLYKETQMQDNFSINMVALVDGAPRLLGIKEILFYFLRHRREVIVRRTVYELRKARARAHTLEGYAVAVANVDKIVSLIKTSASQAHAETALMEHSWPATVVQDMHKLLTDKNSIMPEDADKTLGLQDKGYFFSRIQAKAILDLRLGRLTAMERDKIAADYATVVAEIVKGMELLASAEKIDGVIAQEIKEVKKNFATPRRSEISQFDNNAIDIEDLITPEEMMVTFSHRGYVKRQPISDYRTQRRGGRGKQAAGTREDDFISRLFVASTHDYLLLFTNLGRAFCQKVYELPLASRVGRGRPIVGLLNLREGETVQTVLPIDNFDKERYIVFATAGGIVKKTRLDAFANIRSNGIIAIKLDESDYVINADLVKATGTILLFSNVGKAMRFASDNKTLRATGRVSRGVCGMRFKKDKDKNNLEYIVSMLAIEKEDEEKAILIAADNGRGKRTKAASFPIKGRGGMGVIALQIKTKQTMLIGAVLAGDKDDLMLITDSGVLVRTAMDQIRKMGRITQGFSLIRLDSGRRLVGMARVAEEEVE